jgi:short-subunit dehydrogenase
LIEETTKAFGARIDLLVLCAGTSAHSLFEDFTDMAPFRQVVETNLYGCVYPVRHALKHMKDANRKGHILVLSSYSGEFGLWYRSCYSASKFAVNGFFESLRMELSDVIDITIASPATVDTEFRTTALIKTDRKASDSADGSLQKAMSAQEAVDWIISAADHRLPKLIFPFKPWLAVQLRPFAPKTVASMVKRSAKL